MNELEEISTTFDQLFSEDCEVSRIVSRRIVPYASHSSIKKTRANSFKATKFQNVNEVIDFLALKLPDWEDLRTRISMVTPQTASKQPRVHIRAKTKQQSLPRVPISATRILPNYSPTRQHDYLKLLDSSSKKEINQRIRINKANVQKYSPTQYKTYLQTKRLKTLTISEEVRRAKKEKLEEAKQEKIEKLLGKHRKFKIRRNQGMFNSLQRRCFGYLAGVGFVHALVNLLHLTKARRIRIAKLLSLWQVSVKALCKFKQFLKLVRERKSMDRLKSLFIPLMVFRIVQRRKRRIRAVLSVIDNCFASANQLPLLIFTWNQKLEQVKKGLLLFKQVKDARKQALRLLWDRMGAEISANSGLANITEPKITEELTHFLRESVESYLNTGIFKLFSRKAELSWRIQQYAEGQPVQRKLRTHSKKGVKDSSLVNTKSKKNR